MLHNVPIKKGLTKPLWRWDFAKPLDRGHFAKLLLRGDFARFLEALYTHTCTHFILLQTLVVLHKAPI